MVKTLVDNILKSNSEANQTELFNYVMNNTLSSEEVSYLVLHYEKLKNTTIPENNFARTALILGSKPLIAKAIMKLGIPATDELVDECFVNLISIIDNYDAQRGASFSTYVINYTKYFLQKTYRESKHDAMNKVSVWLDQKVKDDSDTEMHNMIGSEDEYILAIDNATKEEKFENEVESVQKYLKYLTHDEQYLFLVVNGIYDTQIKLSNLAKDLNIEYSFLRGIYDSANRILRRLFDIENTPEQQEIIDKYKNICFSVLQPEDLKDYTLECLASDSNGCKVNRKNMSKNFILMQQKVQQIVESNELQYYGLSILEEKIAYLFYGIDADALSASETAKKLNISLTSVTTHLGAIKRKLSKKIKTQKVQLSKEQNVIDFLNENPNNIYLIPKKYHDMIRKYLGIGEPAVEFNKLCRQFEISSSEATQKITYLMQALNCYNNSYIPFYGTDVESLIKEKNIDVKELFSMTQLRIFNKFYGIRQPRTDIDEISIELNARKSTIVDNLNVINMKLNSHVEGYLVPSVDISNKLLRDVISYCNINLNKLLTAEELQAMQIFLSDSNNINNICNQLNLSRFRAKNRLFSAISKVTKYYNNGVKSGKFAKLKFENDIEFFEDNYYVTALNAGTHGRSKKVGYTTIDSESKLVFWWAKEFLLTLPLKQILTPYRYNIVNMQVGLECQPLSNKEIADKLNIRPSTVSYNISRAKEIIMRYLKNNNISFITESGAMRGVKPAKINGISVEGEQKRQYGLWPKEFLLTLPLENILSPQQYRIISMLMGFENKPLSIDEIKDILIIETSSVKVYISKAKKLIKNYIIKNKISYITESGAEKTYMPAETKTIKAEEQQQRKRDKRIGWFNKEFLIKFPLKDILTEHEYHALEMNLGLNGVSKTYKEIAYELNIKYTTVSLLMFRIRDKLKQYFVKNGISYLTQAGNNRQVHSSDMQKQLSQNTSELLDSNLEKNQFQP